MVEGVSKFFQQKGISTSHTLLLAVSGGIDSMVMAEIVKRLGYIIHVAHVNYHLRALDSDLDEELVRNWCLLHQIPFHCMHASRHEHEKGSVQIWARDIRYAFFERLVKHENLSFICTAHTLNDNIESFFIALKRGGHTQTFAGIPEQNKNIIRPLLKFSKSAITEFANAFNIQWREDKSNQHSDYLRNKIRNEWLPAMDAFLPSNGSFWPGTFKRLNQERTILSHAVDLFKQGACKSTKSGITIQIDVLLECVEPAWFLHEILKPFGFSEALCEQMTQNLTHTHETWYFVKYYSACINKGYIIVNELLKDGSCKYEEVPDIIISYLTSHKSDYQQYKTNMCALIKTGIDITELKLRKWQKGDFFWPTGMNGKKKLSDFFNDLKFTSEEKVNQWLLTYGEDIVWVVNHRIDKRYAADLNAEQVILIQTGAQYHDEGE